MNIIFDEFIKIFPFTSLFILTVYVIGVVVMHFFKSTPKATHSFSDSITLGIFITTLLFSVIYSKGNTFLAIPIIALSFYCISQNFFGYRPLKPFPFQFKKILGFIAVFSVLSIGMMWLIQFDNRLLFHYDISSYARLAHNIKVTGQEKLLLDPIYISDYPKQLFHFFNEWLTVLLSYFLHNLTIYEVLLYVTFPLLTTAIFFQSILVSRTLLGKIKVLDIVLISTIVLLLPNLIKICYHFIPFNSSQSVPSTSVFHSGLYFIKMKVVLLLSLVSYKFYIQNKELTAIIVFSLIPLFWNTLIPVFILGLILLLIYQILNNQKVNKIFYGIQLLSLGLIFIYILVNPNMSENIFSYSILDYVMAKFTDFNYVMKVLVFILISILPLVLFLNKRFRLFLNDTYKKYFYFLLIASFVSYSLIFELYNAKQLIINLIFPILFPISIYLVTISYKVLKIRFRFLAIIVLVFVLFYAVYYRKQLNTDYIVPSAFSSSKVVYLASDIKETNPDPFFHYIRPYGFLMLKNQHWLPQRIDLLDYKKHDKPIDKYHYYQNVVNQSFFKYAVLQYQSKDIINVQELKLKFLREYQFEYLLVNKDKIKDESSSYIQSLNIIDKEMFDDNVFLLKLKW